MLTSYALTVYFPLFLFQEKGFLPLYSPSLSLQTLGSSLLSSYWSEEKVCLHGNQVWFSSFFYFFIRPSISVCISLAFRNLPKHHWKSSWEGNRLLWRVSHLILLLFIWMHVICCHSNHSLFFLECTQKSHLNSKTNAVTKKVGHVQKCSHRLSHRMCGGHVHKLVFAHSSWAKCTVV